MKYLMKTLLSWFKSREEILWTIAFLTSKQPYGQEGVLSIRKKNVIAHFLSDNFTKYVVIAERETDEGLWILDCVEFDKELKNSGDQILI